MAAEVGKRSAAEPSTIAADDVVAIRAMPAAERNVSAAQQARGRSSGPEEDEPDVPDGRDGADERPERLAGLGESPASTAQNSRASA